MEYTVLSQISRKGRSNTDDTGNGNDPSEAIATHKDAKNESLISVFPLTNVFVPVENLSTFR